MAGSVTYPGDPAYMYANVGDALTDAKTAQVYEYANVEAALGMFDNFAAWIVGTDPYG